MSKKKQTKKTKSNSGKSKQARRDENAWKYDLRRRIIEYMSDPKYTPQRFPVLVTKIAADEEERERVTKVLDSLLAEGTVVRLKKKGLALAESADLLAGDIYVTRGGSGFVEIEEPERTIFVPERHTGTALHRDKVLVRVNKKSGRKPGDNLAEGEVIRILERRQRMIVGTLKKTRRFYYVEPMQAQISRDIAVSDNGGANENDRVMVRLEEWTDPKLNPEGEIVEVIGPADDPALDTLAVMKSYGLEEDFPDNVRKEAELVELNEKAYEDRLDLRDTFVFTIDPERARDFDDALSLEKTENGDWWLGIHIADVSHFVTPGSELEKEAYRRATSVYLPDKVVPMLPEQLSNGLCSLKEEQDRLAFSVFLLLDNNATVKETSFSPSVIKSRKRLNYKQALNILELPEGGDPPEEGMSDELVQKLKKCHQLAQQLRSRRSAEGALLMDLPDVEFKFDDNGRIADVEPVQYDISHQLIEEFMLLANEHVCRYLDEKGISQLHRVHAEPDEESLAELREVFRAAGIRTEDLGDRTNLANLLVRIKDMPAAYGLYTSVLKAMKRAEYSIEAVGHYGLAKDYYAHFTSPIRRYPDLVSHRLLKAVLKGEKTPLSKDKLDEIASHCSDREQVASEAEREVTDLKLMRYFSEQLETGNLKEYDAVIVEVSTKGVFVDLPGFRSGGLIHISDLDNDFYDFNEQRNELKGRKTGTVLKVGDKLRVTVARVDTAKRWIDFAPVEL